MFAGFVFQAYAVPFILRPIFQTVIQTVLFPVALVHASTVTCIAPFDNRFTKSYLSVSFFGSNMVESPLKSGFHKPIMC